MRKLIYFFTKPGPKYSLKKSAAFLLLSTALSSLCLTGGYFLFTLAATFTKRSAQEEMKALMLTMPSGTPSLPGPFFAEVLDLSYDIPTRFSQFDWEGAKERLFSLGLIKEVVLKRTGANALSIQYRARIPYAFLGDLTNTLFDEEGILFPCTPFYSPRRLPLVYLGRCAKGWGERIEKKKLAVIHTLFKMLEPLEIEQIDLSRVEEKMLGKREVVVSLKEGHLLRLAPKDYESQLAHYKLLKNGVLKEKEEMIIDLRIAGSAYLQKRKT